MTKLEIEIWSALPPEVKAMGNSSHFITKAAAEVAKKYIEKALIDACVEGWMMEENALGNTGTYSETFQTFRDQYLKENGIIE